MSDRWHYQLLSEEFGPVEEAALLELHRNGTLAADDMVRREQDPEWQPLGSTSLAVESDLATELEDLSQLSFEFEENAPSTRRAAGVSQQPVDNVSEIDDLSELSFEFEENAPTAPKKRATYVPDSVDSEEEEQYWYQSLGQTMGPITLAELIQIAESGGIGDSDAVRVGAAGEWQPASQVEELAAAILSSRFTEESVPESQWISPATAARLGKAGAASPPADPVPSETKSADPAPAQPSPKKQTAESAKAAKPGRKKRRRKKSEDAVLSEIFDEVFTEDEPEKSPEKSSSSAASSSAAASTSSMGAPPPVPAAPSQPTASSSPMGASGFASSTGYSSASVTRPAAAGKPPVAPRPAKSSSGGGFSFDISGGAVITVLCVVLLVGLGASFTMGWISLPSFGTASAGDLKATIKEYYADYKTFIAGNPSDMDWQYFGQDYVPYLADMMADAQSQSQDTEADKVLQEAIGGLLAIVSTRLYEEERRGRLETKVEALLEQLTP